MEERVWRSGESRERLSHRDEPWTTHAYCISSDMRHMPLAGAQTTRILHGNLA